MISGNLTLDDARYNTNAPFTYESSTRINGTQLPVDWFRSIKVYCQEGVKIPVRIGSFTSSSSSLDAVDVNFIDSAGTPVGTAALFKLDTPYKGVFIINPNGVMVGHVVYARELADMLIALVVNGYAYTTVLTEKGAFTLLPQCHVAYAEGCGRVIAVNGRRSVSDVTITPSSHTHTTVESTSNGYKWVLGVVGDYDTTLAENGLCLLKFDKTVTINGVDVTAEAQGLDPIWIGGEHLLIRHSTTSNLRVVPAGNGISFRSVIDG